MKSFDMFWTSSGPVYQASGGQKHTLLKSTDVGNPFFEKISMRTIGWWKSYLIGSPSDLGYERKVVELVSVEFLFNNMGQILKNLLSFEPSQLAPVGNQSS